MAEEVKKPKKKRLNKRLIKKPTTVGPHHPSRRYDEYFNLLLFQKVPVTDIYISRVAQDLIEWVRKDTSIVFNGFLNEMGIGCDAYYAWKERSEDLSHAHAFAMRVLAERREAGAIRKKFDSGLVSYTMPHYDKKWKELVEWREGLKAIKREQQQEGAKIVVIEKFVPDTSKDQEEDKK